MKKITSVLSVLMMLGSMAEVSSQAFSMTRQGGMFELRLTANTTGVPVTIDGESAGELPVTVYVKPGQHVLGFLSPGQPTKNIPLNVNSDLAIPYTKIAPKALFPLTIQVNVPGASIQIDNQVAASNPVAIESGAHTLTVVAPGFLSWTQAFNMPSNATTINVSLQPAVFPLNVIVNVSGATIQVDNVTVSTPAMITAGNHVLTVSAPGYNSYSQSFTQSTRGLSIPVTLTPASFPFSVRINVVGAAVSIDNVPVANFPVPLSPGNHTVTVSAVGYRIFSQAFLMPANETTLTVALVPDFGTVIIKTDEWVGGNAARMVKVFVNGVEQKDKPLQLALPQGVYLIRLEAGIAFAEAKVTVQAGRTITLVPRSVVDLLSESR
jgi:hypothetical protein